MEIRLLGKNGAAVYQALSLQSLKEHPEAFGVAYEEEVEMPMADVGKRLTGADAATLGAFEANELIGIITLARFPRIKLRHRAMINSMYVTPQAREQGVGKALLHEAIAYAHTLDGLEELNLAVTVGNKPARSLYLHAGFTPYSVEPRFIKVGAQYYDIEWMSLRL